jgi:hypothetical protein
MASIICLSLSRMSRKRWAIALFDLGSEGWLLTRRVAQFAHVVGEVRASHVEGPDV